MRATYIHLKITVFTTLKNHLTLCTVLKITTSRPNRSTYFPPDYSKFEIPRDFNIIELYHFYLREIFQFS